MKLPPNTFSMYLGRLDDLIAEGDAVPVRDVQVVSGGNYLTRETYYRTDKQVAWPEFVQWRSKCVTLLDQIVPKESLHRKTVESFDRLEAKPSALTGGVAFLKSIRDDLTNGFLDGLASEIEAEVASDLLGQASRLIDDDTSQGVSHLPAAVLAGAVLEQALRSLCAQLSPSESTNGPSGQPLTMIPLIDALKRRGVFNEVAASQLRAWAAIRNCAAHGQFDRFTKEQAEKMVAGITDFIARHV